MSFPIISLHVPLVIYNSPLLARDYVDWLFQYCQDVEANRQTADDTVIPSQSSKDQYAYTGRG